MKSIDSMIDALCRIRPECYRCGRPVERVEAYRLVHVAGVQLIAHCHGDVEVSTIMDESIAQLCCMDMRDVKLAPVFVPAERALGDGTPVLGAE